MANTIVQYFDAAGEVQAVTPDNPLPVTTTSGGSLPLGYEQVTPLNVATGLTVPAGATYAVITTENDAVRWRDDGTAPTSGLGQQLLLGQTLIYDGDLSAIQFIEVTGGAALNVCYYGEG